MRNGDWLSTDLDCLVIVHEYSRRLTRVVKEPNMVEQAVACWIHECMMLGGRALEA